MSEFHRTKERKTEGKGGVLKKEKLDIDVVGKKENLEQVGKIC